MPNLPQRARNGQPKISIDALALEFARQSVGKLRYARARKTWYRGELIGEKIIFYANPTETVLRDIRLFLRGQGVDATPGRISAVEKLCRLDERLAIRGDER